jgi:HD-GYP domain-containing protein (c-di-GMP phosphodiesterase class II)
MRYLRGDLRFRIFLLVLLTILLGILLTIYTAIPNQSHGPWVLLLIWVSYLAGVWVGGDILIRKSANTNQSMQLYKQMESQIEQLRALGTHNSNLEGWTRALALRDWETEGHSQRVAEMVLRLSRAMSVGEPTLIHIRRGALLHDIGKLSIPDSILLKPGPLNAEESSLIRRHPIIAYEMLAPVAYLRPALDIPYCHHEKWDGTGYPRGLKGEQIPLAARIFAVVDVWDALLSDRPYRKGWPKDKTRAYILEQAGSHFDPRVVDAFLTLLAADENAVRSE